MKKTTTQQDTISTKKKSTSAKKSSQALAPIAASKKSAAPKKTTVRVSTPVKKNPVKTVATSAKKSVSAAKADAKPVKVSAEKVSSKKSSAPLVSKKEQAKKTVAKGVTSGKKVIKEKIVPEVKNIDILKATSSPSKESIKMLGILHLAGNILSGGTLGIILILGYLLIKKDTLTTIEKETCYEIINFNLSFIIYAFIAGVSMMILIGFVLLPIVIVTWLLLLILGFLGHLNGENYQYPFIIRFIK